MDPMPIRLRDRAAGAMSVLRAGALLAAVAVGLAACGKTTIRPEGAERVVVNVVSSQTGFRPNDVRCPSGVEAKVGVTFQCRFTGPEGPYTAYMRVTEVEGERVEFAVLTRPSRG